MKGCKAVTKFVFKKPCRLVCKRITALSFATALLFSSVSVGVLVPETEVKAIAGVDDTAVLAEFLKIIIALASSAGGVSNDEMFTSADAAGITSWEDARGYIHGSFSGDPNFRSLFDFDDGRMIQVECMMAASVLMGGYVFSQKYLNKLWAQYDPREDGWDPEKWSDLTEKEKVKIIYDTSDVLLNAGIIPVGPPGGGDDNDNEDDTDGEKSKSHYKEGGKLIDENGDLLVLDTGAVNAAFTTATFQTVYYLAKKLNYEEKKDQLMGEKTGVFNYSFQDWADNIGSYPARSDIVALKSADLIPSASSQFDLSIGFTSYFFDNGTWGNPNYVNYSNTRIFPCLYWADDVPFLGLTTDKGIWSAGSALGNYHRFPTSTGNDYAGISPLPSGFAKINLHDGFRWRNSWSDFNFSEFDYLLKNRKVLSGKDKYCTAPWLIDCGTETNFSRFSVLIQSGDYTLNDLLKCMKDGWKGDQKKTWKSVEDKGETAKKAMESDKGKKYKDTGKKYNKDGNKTEGEGVSFSSLVDGMHTPSDHDMESSVTSPQTGVDDLLGGQVTIPDPVRFPSSEDYPDGAFYIPNAQIPSSPDTPDATPTPAPTPTPEPEPGVVPAIPGTDSEIQWYERFPFCIPWDLYNGVSALKANTKVPRFDLPFEIKRLGVSEKVTVDFSEYEKLAILCRWFFRLLFGVGLAMISRSIIKG